MRFGKPTLIFLMIAALPAVAAASDDGAVAMTHRMMMLAIQVGVILFAAKLGNILFRRLRLPGALGELAAGILIGPFALGRVAFYGFDAGVFPIARTGPISPELTGLAAIASVVLLFHIGLETDLKMLLRYAVAGGLVGLGGMIAAFFGGAACVMVFSESLLGEPVGLLAPPCLFLGAVTTATSVGLTARILSEKRKLDSPEGVTIISAAVIDDVLGIILLAMVMSIVAASKTAGVDWGHVAVVGAKAVGIWLGATALALAASLKIAVLLKWFGERNSIAILALGLALILAGLFEEAGLAMIIGAYVMGLSLSTADIRHVVEEKLSPVYALLVPIFFCTSGMRIDLTALGSPVVLAFGLAYAVVATASKVIGCGLPALLVNFNLRGAARIGFGMAPRCEVALIIASVGLSAELLTPAMFAGVIIMVMVNTIIAPPVFLGLLSSKARGTRRPVEADTTEAETRFEFPSIEMAEFFVGKLAPVFEAEGFFVHQLSHDHGLYQLRKDKRVIDLAHRGRALTFASREADAPLIRAGVYEALAAVERAVQAMRKPVDAGAMRAGLQDEGPLGPAALDLGAYLNARLIEPNLKGRSKTEIIDELLDLLDREGLLADRAEAHRAVWEREDSMSTGLQYGVAIPHGKTDAVNRLVCCAGVAGGGVDFDSMDGQPSRIFILTLSPKTTPAPHLQFMSTISSVLNNVGRKRVLACDTADEILRVFAGAPAGGRRPMPTKLDLADYIRPDCVQPRLAATDKEGVIRELTALLVRAGYITDEAAALDAVLQRENQLSTGMAEGLAIPHGKTDAVKQMVCAIGVKAEGFDFGSIDGAPTRIFVLVLTTPTGSEPYLQFIASLMGALSEEGRTRVLGAETPEELVAALTGGV